jgi:hypothetical protein
MTKFMLRVAFFVWSMALWKILTTDNLQKWNVIVVDWHFMCKRNRESVENLRLHCEVDCVIWNVFFSRFKLSWVIPRRVVDSFACW